MLAAVGSVGATVGIASLAMESFVGDERSARIAGSTRAFESHPFNVITVQHLDRLLGGELLARAPRLDWARLLRRTYGFDPLKCPHCGHRLRPLAEISERQTIHKILAAVGYERRSTPRARTPARARSDDGANAGPKEQAPAPS